MIEVLAIAYGNIGFGVVHLLCSYENCWLYASYNDYRTVVVFSIYH